MAGAITITTTTLADAQQYKPVEVQIETTGGDGGNVWTKTAGSLPPGITLSNFLEVGILSGTPTTVGTYNFTIRVDDSTTHDDDQAFTWIVGVLLFPLPTSLGLPGYKRFYAAPKPWGEVTDSHQYADGGMSFNRRTDTPLREWELEIDCNGSSHSASKALTDLYDAFSDNAGVDRTFSFTDKYGTTHTGVRIKSYERNHAEHKSWIQSVSFVLWKLP